MTHLIRFPVCRCGGGREGLIQTDYYRVLSQRHLHTGGTTWNNRFVPAITVMQGNKRMLLQTRG